MHYSQLGRARLEVSRLCLGTMNFVKFADPQRSHEMLSRAVDLGINYVDTANSYGVAGRPGAVEEVIGEWFAKTGRREQVVLATKLFEAQAEWPNSGGLSALNIRRACEASLRRLRTDHIDVLQMHHVDRLATWPEIWEAFGVLRDQGKILYAGSSNFAGWQLAVAQYEADRRNFYGLVSEQSVYNLSQRTLELEVLPAAQSLGIGVIAWSPLAGGLLTGTPLHGDGRRNGDLQFQDRRRRHAEALAATSDLADARSATIPQLSLSWLLAQPGLTSAVIGPRTLEQLDDLVASVDIALDAAEIATLDEIWPGPGGQAPEAYAW